MFDGLGGVTPLHRACYKGHNNIVQLLLSNGGDPQLVDNDGMTALHKVRTYMIDSSPFFDLAIIIGL